MTNYMSVLRGLVHPFDLKDEILRGVLLLWNLLKRVKVTKD
jgi:hypothetical protein